MFNLTDDGLILVPPGTVMADPPHPGALLSDEFLAPLGLSVTQAAEALRVGRQTVSELVNGRRGVSVDMAIRLEKVFGFRRDMWLAMQATYDLAHADDEGIVIGRSYRPAALG